MSSATTLRSARAAAGVRTIDLSDGTTAYHVHGTRGPWVVLVHGLLSPMFTWQGIADTLAAAGYRVLRYDELGRGLSDRPPVRYDLALYVRQLRELTAALALEPMHLIGWSMGGIICSRFALEYPASVDRMALIAPALFMRKQLKLRLLQRMPGGDRLLASRVGDFLDALPAQHFEHPERFVGYRERGRAQLDIPGLGQSFASTVRHFPWQAGRELGEVGAHPRPVLVIWGDDDQTVPYAGAPRVLALYPRAELMVFEGARHAPHLEHAEAAQARILTFLNRPSAPASR